MTIKQLRQVNRLSQRDLAKLVGVTQAAINKWERQEVKLSKKNQERIYEIFGINASSITKRATSYDIGI